MTCQNCVNAVQSSLRDVSGIERYDIDLENKRVTIIGKTPPSNLLSALKSTNRQVIVRGSSPSDPNFASTFPQTAAVSILESPISLPTSIASTSNPVLANSPSTSSPSSSSIPTKTQLFENLQQPLPGMNEEEFSQKVFGIARFLQIEPSTILLDLTVRLPPPSAVGLGHGPEKWKVYISQTGNITNPPSTTGKPLMELGEVELDKNGYGDMFKEIKGELWEWVGRGCIVQSSYSPQQLQQSSDSRDKGLGKIFAGVVARSAGAWGNEKTVCACSGRTMWEEGRDMEKKTKL
nr:copper chaperone [Kwoniella dejecticola CBS 10117]OBR82545.1 copper chaperone [Kwoniella dejecticola CBS 10117]